MQSLRKQVVRIALRFSSLKVHSTGLVQVSDETICISFRANVIGKGMNSSLLSEMGKTRQKRVLSILDRVTSPREGKLWN